MRTYFALTDGGVDSPKIHPDDATSSTFGIVGQRGTGKSSAAAVIVEELARAGSRVVVCDPTGVWYGLAHAGRGPGIEKTIILGGEHANAPLEETGGAVVADMVLNADYSVVVLDMKLLRKGAQVRFMADFLEALYHGNRESLMVVIDEAGRFAPQALREKGYAIRLLGAIEDVVKLGRARGLGCILVEQRVAHISKSVFEQIETLISFRLMGPNDRKALSSWIEAQGDPALEKEAMNAITKAKTGVGLVWSPALLNYFGVVHFKLPTTFDSRRTPRPGERTRAPGERAPVDLEALTKKMSETIQRAKENDPKALREELAKLRSQKPEPVVVAPPKEALDALTKERRAVEAAVNDLTKAMGGLALAANVIAEAVWPWQMKQQYGALRDVREHPRPPEAGLGFAHVSKIGSIEIPARPRVARSLTKALDDDFGAVRRGDRALSGSGEKRILSALVLHGTAISRADLAVVSVMKASGGSFGTYLSRLKVAGHIEIQGDNVYLTPAGKKAAGIVLPCGPAEVAAAWRPKFGGGAGRIFDFLYAQREPSTRDEVATAVEMSSDGGSFGTYLSRLRSAGAVVERDGLVEINPLLRG